MSLIIHSGLGKTASTALQEIVFPRSESHIFLGKNSTALGPEGLNISNRFMQPEDQFIMRNFFSNFHNLVFLISNGRDKKSHWDSMAQSQKLIINKGLNERNYIISHERMSHLKTHLRPTKNLPASVSFRYPIELWNELLRPFYPITFFNTTRSPVEWLTSMYFQLSQIHFLQIGDFPTPEEYFSAQKFIYLKKPELSLFWSYRLWSSSPRFANFVKCDPESICTIKFEDMITSSISDLMRINLKIKLAGSARDIDESFKKNKWKDSKSEKIKQEISKKLLLKCNADPSIGFEVVKKQIQRYIELEFKDVLCEMVRD